MDSEYREYAFNFPYGAGAGTDAQAVEGIVTAVGGLRMETGLFYEDSPRGVNPMDGRACMAALGVVREAERVLARFPLWMVNGCWGEMLRGSTPELERDGCLDALLEKINAEGGAE